MDRFTIVEQVIRGRGNSFLPTQCHCHTLRTASQQFWARGRDTERTHRGVYIRLSISLESRHASTSELTTPFAPLAGFDAALGRDE